LKQREQDLRNMHREMEIARLNLVKDTRAISSYKNELEESAADEELIEFQKQLSLINLKNMLAHDKFPLKSSLNVVKFSRLPVKQFYHQKHLRTARQYLSVDAVVENQREFLRSLK
jgi:hypothetical protein